MLGGNPLDADAIVIGGGFGGCSALYRLRQLGLQTKLLEAGADFGGVWYWNRYPGAAVDTETPTYQLNIPEVWKTWNWTKRFPEADELRRYFQHVDQTLDLKKDAFFNATVTRVQYSEYTHRWTVTTKNGLRATCKYLIAATGSSIRKYYPEFPGVEQYQGQLVHSAAYPDDLDVHGKRVGVVGNGAAGLQIVQALAKQDCQLTVFIRTPCIAIPMKQRSISPSEAEYLKGYYNAIFDKCYRSSTGFPNNTHNQSAHQATLEEREALFEEIWERGGHNFFLSNYSDFLTDERVNSMLYDYWAKRVRARITDPAKMDIVAPLKQEQFVATKRPSLEQDYYEMIDRPNVRLHSLKQSPIVGFDRTGLVTGQGDQTRRHELDVIVFATGYDAVTGSILNLSIEGRHHTALGEKWKDGILTHLGMMVPDMPNLFMVYGPQAPTSLANGPPFIEMQVNWICNAISKMRDDDLDSIEPTQKAAEEWREHVLMVSRCTLLPKADSWYMGANIPGKRREPLIYVGGLSSWWQRCLQALESWQDFTTRVSHDLASKV